MEEYESLMRPRYMVIADFPQPCFHPHKVGDILTASGFFFIGKGFTIPENEIDNYPAVIRKLEWCEKREEKDMPKYLKLPDGSFMCEPDYHTGDPSLFYLGENGEDQYLTWDFLPATEEEYLEYISKNK